MSAADPTLLSVAEAAVAIQAGRLSPVDLTAAYLDRIERLNPSLNAYITVTAELAREQAQAAEAALAVRYRGPLHGIPYGLKDIYATRGIRTTAGSRLFADWVPDEDSTVGEKLHAVGGVLLGKLNTHELAFGVTTNNPHFGPTRNPWDRERIPGGSSGGSAAAVAAGLAAFAMGTDTGGSIRIPASLCGVVGLKPTHGRVSTAGVLPLSWSLDHVGPLTRTVEDAAIVLQPIAGYDPSDTLTPPVFLLDYRAALGAGVRGLRLGVLRGGFCEGMDHEVATAFEAALDVFAGLGAELEEVAEAPELWRARLSYLDIQLAEARFLHREALRDRADEFGPDVLQRLNRRTDLSAEELVAAFRQQDAAIRESEALLERFDALLCPTTRVPAPRIDPEQMTEHNGERVTAASVLVTNTAPFDVTGQPALSLPCGFTAAGLPIGLQVIGRRWGDGNVLWVAAAYERATPWHERRPG